MYTSSYKCGQILPTQLNLPVSTQVRAIAILNYTLATLVDLKTQIKYAQWNVTGTNCAPLQELFAEIAAQLEEYTDIFAERITELGGLASITAREVSALSVLPEYPHGRFDGSQHVAVVTQRLKICAQSLLQGSLQTAEWKDFYTCDLFVEVMQVMAQRSQLLSAHLQAALPAKDTQSIPRSQVNSISQPQAIA
jgi:starvation-inducible DNA-binding protein